MTKTELIARILDNSRIHHNISTLGLKLPDAPDGIPDDTFFSVCSQLVSDFCDNWLFEPRNDSGNRNICGCNATKEGEKHLSDDSNVNRPENMTATRACKKHDFWHCYTTGRMGATLYWDKFWSESQGSYHGFKYDADELKEKRMSELLEINDDINAFNKAVAEMLASLPAELEYSYKEWAKADKEEKRREALGYNKTLSSLLDDTNPAIVRLAKGIKKELNK